MLIIKDHLSGVDQEMSDHPVEKPPEKPVLVDKCRFDNRLGFLAGKRGLQERVKEGVGDFLDHLSLPPIRHLIEPTRGRGQPKMPIFVAALAGPFLLPIFLAHNFYPRFCLPISQFSA